MLANYHSNIKYFLTSDVSMICLNSSITIAFTITCGERDTMAPLDQGIQFHYKIFGTPLPGHKVPYNSHDFNHP